MYPKNTTRTALFALGFLILIAGCAYHLSTRKQFGLVLAFYLVLIRFME